MSHNEIEERVDREAVSHPLTFRQVGLLLRKSRNPSPQDLSAMFGMSEEDAVRTLSDLRASGRIADEPRIGLAAFSLKDRACVGPGRGPSKSGPIPRSDIMPELVRAIDCAIAINRSGGPVEIVELRLFGDIISPWQVRVETAVLEVEMRPSNIDPALRRMRTGREIRKSGGVEANIRSISEAAEIHMVARGLVQALGAGKEEDVFGEAGASEREGLGYRVAYRIADGTRGELTGVDWTPDGYVSPEKEGLPGDGGV